METPLQPLVLAYAPVLRQVREQGSAGDLKALADGHGKVASNLRRDFAKLVDLGVLSAEGHALTGLGYRLVRGIDVAEGLGAFADAPEGHVWALPHEIARHPRLNPRKRFDEAGLDELRESILTKGLLQAPVLRPVVVDTDGADDTANGVRFWIVAGERRLRAIATAVEDGDWPEERPILCKLQPMSDAEHRRLALAENLQRVDLDHLDLAELYRERIDEDGETVQSLAVDINKTPEHVQQHLRLLRLPEPVQARLRLAKDDPEALTFHQALRLLAKPASPAPAPAGTDADDSPQLTATQALILGEVWEKARLDPRATESGGYTRIADQPTETDTGVLVVSGLLSIRWVSGEHYAGVTRNGAAWIRAQGAAWPDVLWNLRAAVKGGGMARECDYARIYLTPWLNLPELTAAPAPPAGDAGEGRPADGEVSPAAQFLDPAAPLRSPQPAGEAHDYAATHPDQAALIPPDPEEAAEIERRRAVQARRDQLAGHFAHLSEQVLRRLDVISGHLDFVPAWDIADRAACAVIQGDFTTFMAAYVELSQRAGAMNAAAELRGALYRGGVDDRALRAKLAKDGPGFAAAHEGLDLSHLQDDGED
jgi:ParB/RepB/Spo0J family partition protein